jgi:hypothetical protein
MQNVDVIQLLQTVKLEFKAADKQSQSNSSNFGDIFSSVSKSYNEENNYNQKNIKNDNQDSKYNKREDNQDTPVENRENDKPTDEIIKKDNHETKKIDDTKKDEKIEKNDDSKKIEEPKEESKEEKTVSTIESSVNQELQAIVDQLGKDGVDIKSLEPGELKELVSKFEDKLNKIIGEKLDVKITVDENFKVDIQSKNSETDNVSDEKITSKNNDIAKDLGKIKEIIQTLVNDSIDPESSKKDSKQMSRLHLVKLQVKNESETKVTTDSGKTQSGEIVKTGEKTDLDKLILDVNKKVDKKKQIKSDLNKNEIATDNKIDLEQMKLDSRNKKNIKVNKILKILIQLAEMY